MERHSLTQSAFSLIELMITMAAMAVLAAGSMIMISGSIRSAREQKLESDVVTLNAALSTFRANGGDLEGANTAAQIIERIKTRALDGQGDQLVGVRASMLDPRITPVLQNSAEAARATARVHWNPSKRRFVLSYHGGVGIKKFVLDESKADALEAEHERLMVVEYSKKGQDKWVWEYADHSTGGNTGPSNVPTTLEADNIGGSTSGALTLAPPEVSPPGDTYAIADYDGLTVILTDPNPAGASLLFYSVIPDIWERYVGPISIDPGTVLASQAVSVDRENWSNSDLAADTYVTTPVQLAISIVFPTSTYDYVSLGGAIEPGNYTPPTPPAPGVVSLTNSAAIPTGFLNSDVFSILWTMHGGDPRNPAGWVPEEGDAFSGGFPDQEIPLLTDYWGSADTITVKAYAKSHNGAILSDSDLAEQTLTADRITLREPLITIDPFTGAGTLALDVDYADTPLGAQIFYTTDGSDPGIGPDGGSLVGALYTGSIPDAGAGPLIARAYPPVLHRRWFLPSSAAEERPPVAPIVFAFTMGVSTEEP